MTLLVQMIAETDQRQPFPPGSGGTPGDPVARRIPFFGRVDWLSFALAASLTLAVYRFTLAPDVTLGSSGTFCVGAVYAGVPHPPGYPVWTLYAWLFTEFLPVSNTAWRVGVASAVAGALACGVVALMVSRAGAAVAQVAFPRTPMTEPDANTLRIVCGAVAGMGLGFDGAFWREAVVAGPWTLSLLLFSLVLCFLTRWCFEPGRHRFLYLACFFYGLTVTNSYALIPAALGLPVFVLVNRPRGLVAMGKFAAKGAAMFLLGTSAFLYLPIASMTNPPVNWGYARMAEGFIHTLERGQFERVYPTESLAQYLDLLWSYAGLAARDFGWLYLVAALIPLKFLNRLPSLERSWLLSLAAVFLSLSAVTVALLNPSDDRQSLDLICSYYTASHLVLALWSGCGLLLAGQFLFNRGTRSEVSKLSVTHR